MSFFRVQVKFQTFLFVFELMERRCAGALTSWLMPACQKLQEQVEEKKGQQVRQHLLPVGNALRV